MKKNELILSVRDLNIKFNLRGKILHAIRGIDLDVYHGEVLAIVGESGSGKSVFTKSFMGLLDSNGSITSGTIDYFGADDHQPIRLSELKKEKDWLKVRGHEIALHTRHRPEHGQLRQADQPGDGPCRYNHRPAGRR